MLCVDSDATNSLAFNNWSAWVGRLAPSVCLFCLQHNSKTNCPKLFKLGIENDLGISEK